MEEIPFMGHRRARLFGHPLVVSRSGFTGEIGFELFCDAEHVAALWRGLEKAGRSAGLIPYGYRCVDLLRIEAGFTLYPTDLTLAASIWEAGPGWLVRGKEVHFVGRKAVLEARGRAKYRVAGVRSVGEALLAPPASVQRDDQRVGLVTSSAFSPDAEKTLSLVRVLSEAFEDGAEVLFEGETTVPGRLTELPFQERRC